LLFGNLVDVGYQVFVGTSSNVCVIELVAIPVGLKDLVGYLVQLTVGPMSNGGSVVVGLVVPLGWKDIVGNLKFVCN